MYRQINIALNFLKGVACMGVVFIHVTFPGLFGEIIASASAYAVPIFFMIAGYYSFNKGTDVIKRRLFKIIKIFIYGYCLYLIFNVALAIKDHQLSAWLNTNFNWKTPVKYVIFCTVDFAIPLWYLIAMIETYFVWLLVVKYRKEEKIIKFIPALFLLYIILTVICETCQLSWFLKINFLTRALPWFLTGYFFHTTKKEKLKSISVPLLFTITLCGCLITIIPVAFNLVLKFSCIGYIPYATGLFIFCLKYSEKSICKSIEYIGSNLSLNIYIIHPLIGNIVGLFLFKLTLFNFGDAWVLWSKPFIVLVITIIFSAAIETILKSYKRKCGVLQ